MHVIDQGFSSLLPYCSRLASASNGTLPVIHHTYLPAMKYVLVSGGMECVHAEMDM